MTPNNNLSPLPIYGSLAEQDFRKPWAYGNIPCLPFLTGSIPPFFVRIENKTVQFVTMALKKPDGTVVKQYTQVPTGLRTTTKNGIQMLWVDSNASPAPFSGNVPEGNHYLDIIITFTDTTSQNLFSEVFTYVNMAGNDGFVKLNWFSEEDQVYEGGFIPYEEGYRNFVFLHTSVGYPQYNFEEEATERDGFIFVKKQLSEKTYKFTFAGPEYLCDALRLVRLSDHAIVVDEEGRQYVCDSFLINVDWLEQGHYAQIGAEFDCDTVVKALGRSNTVQSGLILTPTEISMSAVNPANQIISVFGATGDLSFSGAPSGVTLSAVGNTAIIVASQSNPSMVGREAEITVSDAAGKQSKFTFRQAGTFAVEPTLVNLAEPYHGTTPVNGSSVPEDDVLVKVTSEVSWTITPDHCDVYRKTGTEASPVYTLLVEAGQTSAAITGNAELVFVPEENITAGASVSTNDRALVNVFTIGGSATKNVVLNQPGYKWQVVLPSSQTYKYADEGETPVNGQAVPDSDLQVTVRTTAKNWSVYVHNCTVYELKNNFIYERLYSGTGWLNGLNGTKTLVFVSYSNTEMYQRNYTFTFRDPRNLGQVLDAVFILPGVAPGFPNNEIPVAGGTGTTAINVRRQWTFITPAWFNVDTQRGTGTATVTWTVGANTTGSPRTAVVGIGSPTLDVSQSVTQAGS